MKRLLKVIPMLLLMIVATGINAQQKVSVSGTVVDAKNLPLIGVAVVEKGTRNGVETNLDGKYSISVSSSNSILVFSYLGFVTKEVSVKDASVVVLNEDTQLLSEVVVIGYGQVRKKDATGAITVIKPELLNRGAVTSPQDLLVGKVAGVQITPGDGAPGSGPTIRIRGGASLKASNDPLLVIDGIPLANDAAPGMRNALASINPNDIESFTILKDASSTAIYGSRGSNGVIIINTKKGSKNFKLDYSSTYSVNQNIKTLNALSASEFKAKLEEAYPAGSTVANAIASLM
ncbi:MAG: TonB-dependent receptor plug domain-containing protein [Bacteroidales bacterium]